MSATIRPRRSALYVPGANARALEKARGASTAVQIAAARAGDDYELLFALPRGATPPVRAIPIGYVSAGTGLTLMIDGAAVPLPGRLGWEH